MPNLFDSDMSDAQAAELLDALARSVESPYQQAITVAIDRMRERVELANLVRKVRKAQKDYFADQTRENLVKSKELERRLDSLVKE